MREIMPQLEDPSAAGSLRHVFVYGTLRRGEQRDINRLLPAPVWVGSGRVAGTLYDLGRYPGLMLGAGGEAVGEVYRVTAGLERLLDEIEEVWPQESGEYIRNHVPVTLQDGAPGASRERVCLIYAVNPVRTHGRSVIVGGDWVQHRLTLPGKGFS
jgi:gamma-glutamylcyclotransferase (GGCT)/AIG2-like uncharacterized protein YtfP